MYHINSTLEEILKNPIGGDIVDLIFDQISNKYKWLLKLKVIRKMKLSTLVKLSGGKEQLKEIFEVIIYKMNESTNNGLENHNYNGYDEWWNEAVIYQIYPRSFMDSNDDGIGDIRGIISKVGYIKALGVDAIWLSPVYDSPNDDNGYDIRDYKKIQKEYGTLEDMEELIRVYHEHGIRVIMDLVLNHTSDEHIWFKKALQGDEKYKKYYFFRKEGKENNWSSIFSGSAWEKTNTGECYLHLFSKKQPDLNWEDESLREDMSEIARWWAEKGVDGFRLDVINFISKRKGLPDGNRDIGKITGHMGIEHYLNGPNIHKYIGELNRKVFGKYNLFTVGECNGLGLKTAKYFISRDREELSTVLSFRQMYMPGRDKWDEVNYDFNHLVDSFIDIQKNTDEKNIYALFTENHDSTRFVSKITRESLLGEVLSKSVCALMLFLRGIPFIYQGQELALEDPKFSNIDDILDVESKNKYKEMTEAGLSLKEAESIIIRSSRDNSRVPMIWTDEEYGGFSEKEPWLWGEVDISRKNAANQAELEDSVLNFYRKAIRIRKENKLLISGEFKLIYRSKNLFVFSRIFQEREGICVFNTGNSTIKRRKEFIKGELVLSNYEYFDKKHIKPYEFNLYI